METVRVSLGDGESVDVGVLGPETGRSVLYFHSPSTSGEELHDAESVIDRLHLRVITLKRPTIVGDKPSRFVEAVATDIEAVIGRMSLDRPVVLGWSGGAPYALASAARLGEAIDSVHLVSPVPGALTGPDAIPDQSERLRQVADTTPTSPWVSGASTLRDYQAVASPWTFSLASIPQPVTLWAPNEDEIVPAHLINHLASRLTDSTLINVAGLHDWLTHNWSTVFERIAD